MLPGSVYPTLVRLPVDYLNYYNATSLVRLEPVPDGAKEVVFKPLLVAAGAPLFGSVVDAARRHVADADVIGSCPLPDRVGDRLVFARSDRDGNFMLPGSPTNANVKVTAYSTSGVTANPVTGSVHDADPMCVAVDPNGGLSVSGRAVDSRGRPRAGATVCVFPVRFNQNRFAVEEDFVAFGGTERLHTDEQGRFVTPKQLRPDRAYCAFVDAPGMTPVRTEPIEPIMGRTIDFGDIVLTPTPRLRVISGQVVDPSGQPVGGAIVKQSGDGPRPTRAISDADGNFRIDGVYEGPAWLFIGHEGFRLQAEPIVGDARELVVVLGRDRIAVSERRPASGHADDEVAVCRALFAEHRDRIERGPESGRLWAAAVEYMLDGNPLDRSGAEMAYALYRRALAHEQAMELAQAIDDMRLRCLCYLAAFDAIGTTQDVQLGALAEALLAARAVDAPENRIPLLNDISERFFDVGDRQVGAAILREARDQLAAILPDEAQARLDTLRGALAPALAFIDPQAAHALIEKLSGSQRDWLLADVSRSLATENPAEAEQAIAKIEMPNLRYLCGAGTVHRMAAVDFERAARIARSFPKPANQAYALALVAEAQASARPDLAGKLVDEAYELLEKSQTDGTADGQYSTCGTAAALLVMVERVSPAMLGPYLARALSMRPPRPARGDPGARYEREIAEMALAIVPYDRKTARALLEPLAPRIRTLSALGERYVAYGQIWTAFALVDPSWARQLVESLPDAPPEATISPRVTAAKRVIEALVHRGAGRWPWVYWRYLHARHPDTPVRER